eukprot:Filipodium_phascolosomae@DN3459_c0_g1_i1.p1
MVVQVVPRYPMYGSGDLSQAFCRLCAVNEGTYMLRKVVQSISLADQPTSISVTDSPQSIQKPTIEATVDGSDNSIIDANPINHADPNLPSTTLGPPRYIVHLADTKVASTHLCTSLEPLSDDCNSIRHPIDTNSRYKEEAIEDLMEVRCRFVILCGQPTIPSCRRVVELHTEHPEAAQNLEIKVHRMVIVSTVPLLELKLNETTGLHTNRETTKGSVWAFSCPAFESCIPVHVLQLDHSSGCCPRGYWVSHFCCSADADGGNTITEDYSA